MNREQAINYLICCGITEYQVSEIVRALTYKPKDCKNCKHYVVTDTRTNWGSQETTKIYGCERWECKYEPTTKNDSSELEKNSKKLEKDFGELDCISREQALRELKESAKHHANDSREEVLLRRDRDIIRALPSVTPQLSVPEVTALAEWTEKLTKASEDAYNKGYADGMKAQEPRKGHWIKGYTFPDGAYWKCDKCNELIKVKFPMNYCNNCGADMREVKE